MVGIYWTESAVEDWYIEWFNGGIVWRGEERLIYHYYFEYYIYI